MEINFLRKAQYLHKKILSSPLMSIFKIMFVAAAFVFMGWAVVAGVSEFQSRAEAVSFGPIYAGAALVFIASLLGGVVWHCVMRSFHLDLPWQQNLIVHMVSNVAKYLPGYGWHYLSKGYLINSILSTSSAFLIIATEAVILIGSGASLGFAFTAAFPTSIFYFHNYRVGALVGLLLVLLATAIWTRYAGYKVLSARTNRQYSKVKFIAWMLIAWVAGGLGWLALSGAALLFIKAVDGMADVTFIESLIALTFSSVLGFIVIFVPAGLGVREAAMGVMLSPLAPLPLTITVSLLLRIIVILSEMLQLGAVFLWSKHWPTNLKKLLSFARFTRNNPNGVL